MEALFNFDLASFIQAAGLIGVTAIVFAESGLLIGFFLPGDSLLFTAGFLASGGFFNIWHLAVLTFLGAVIGDNVGYTFGYRIGPRIFKKESSRLFNKENLDKANRFYNQHGPITIVIARFTPIIRTFAPILAGVGKMNYRTFFIYNLVGGALWTTLLLWAGYFLGQLIPDIDRYLLPIVALIIYVSVLPSVKHLPSARIRQLGVVGGGLIVLYLIWRALPIS